MKNKFWVKVNLIVIFVYSNKLKQKLGNTVNRMKGTGVLFLSKFWSQSLALHNGIVPKVATIKK